MALPRSNVNTGVLAGHVKQGRVLRSPLAATGALVIGDWIRDDAPDLIWPILLFSERGDNVAKSFVDWQRAVLDDLDGVAEPRPVAECLDGRLTGLARLAAMSAGTGDTIRKRADEHGLLPEILERVLSAYPMRPAPWFSGGDFVSHDVDTAERLSRALLGVYSGGHREALIKCLGIWALVQARALSTSQETIDVLIDYPQNVQKHDQADSTVRSMWGAMRGATLLNDATAYDDSIRWARGFWGLNWMMSMCIRTRELDNDRGDENHEGTDEPMTNSETQSQADDDGELEPAEYQQRAKDLISSYVEALEKSPQRLYDPERQEVHAGLVSRVGREVVTALGLPDLWCSEFGSHIGRTLAETRIVLAWMALQDQATIYKKYQAYGAGKAKLYAALFEKLPQEWLVEGVAESIDAMSKASHNDPILDYREVDLSATFADGKSLRQMAEEADLSDLYKHAYQLASGVTHSEWWSVEMHSMERCLNALHRGHLIPSLDLSTGNNPTLARSWIIALQGLIFSSMRLLGVTDQARQEAFGWLTDDE